MTQRSLLWKAPCLLNWKTKGRGLCQMEFFIELRLSLFLIRMLIYVIYCPLYLLRENSYFIASSSLVIENRVSSIFQGLYYHFITNSSWNFLCHSSIGSSRSFHVFMESQVDKVHLSKGENVFLKVSQRRLQGDNASVSAALFQNKTVICIEE